MHVLKMIWWFRKVSIYTLLFFMAACSGRGINENPTGMDKFEALNVEELPANLAFFDTTYVSIYSDIYSVSKDTKISLTATLSLRNTSMNHSIYITEVDYYGSSGKKVKSFLSSPIVLMPLESVEYIIDRNDNTGGTGANFIINWCSESENVSPLFEGVMLSTSGQHGISYTTQGISISNR